MESGAELTPKLHDALLEERELSATVSTVLWDWFYEPDEFYGDTARRRAGMQAMKRELIYAGFGKAVDVDVLTWGDAVTTRTKEFQAVEGVAADGVIGRVTARHLFRKRCREQETAKALPAYVLGRLLTWESQNDPVCRGVSADEGVAQISPPNHPDVTLAQMWDPGFAIPFAAGYLRGAYIYVGGDWDGAVASYNVGAGTGRKWVVAGKPASGGPILGYDKDGNPIDAWVRCTFYVDRVHNSNW